MLDRARLTLAPLLVATAGWFAVWAAYPLGWRHWNGALNVTWAVVGLLAGATAVVATLGHGDRPTTRSFRLLAAASFAWAAGRAVWTYDVVVAGTAVPYPSLADVGYLASYALFAAALAVWPRRRRRFEPGHVVWVGLAAVAAALVIFEFAIQPVVAGGVSGWVGVLDVVYPAAGLGLATVALMGLLFDRWSERGPLLVVLGGLFLLGIADTAFAHVSGVYSKLLDPLWTVPFVAVAVAPFVRSAWIDAKLTFPEWARVAVPMTAFVAVRAPHVVQDLRETGYVEAIEEGAISVILLAVVLQGVRMVRQRKREADRLARTKAELERAYAERNASIEASRTGLAFFDNRSPRFCNRAFLELLDPVVGGNDWSAFLGELDAAADGGHELVLDRGERRLRVRLTALSAERVLVTVDDVTQEERERESRDRFVVEVLRSRDREVRKISELLHDDAVQELSALALRLELDGVRTGRDELIGFARDANAITASIRKLLVDLNPPVLESRGLAAAIDSAADALRSSGVEVHVDDFSVRFAPELEQLAYRVAQEALANVLFHAGARRVDVSLRISGRLLECEVADDGIGFDAALAETALSRGGVGLHVARERLELVRGTLEVGTGRHGGTTVRFSFPVGVAAPEVVAA